MADQRNRSLQQEDERRLRVGSLKYVLRFAARPLLRPLLRAIRYFVSIHFAPAIETLRAQNTALRIENEALRGEMTALREQLDAQRRALDAQVRHYHEQIAMRDRRLAAEGVDGSPTTMRADDAIWQACLRLGTTEPIQQHDLGSPRNAHAIVTLQDGSQGWLKVTSLTERGSRALRREIEADKLTDLPKPELIGAAEWEAGGIFYHARLRTVASSPAISRSPWRPPKSSAISDDWIADLRHALSSLRRVKTARHVLIADEVRELIATYLGPGLPDEVEIWEVTHGDLTWANLTAPKLTLLDWENWGLAPPGYGPGRLITSSLLEPELAARLETTFAAEFRSRSGFVGLLAAVAQVKQQVTAEGISALAQTIDDFLRRICLRQLNYPPDSLGPATPPPALAVVPDKTQG
jgi:hypothetical protein